MKVVTYIIPTIIMVSLFASFIFYNVMPSMMTIHWDANGNPDGYAPKEKGAFMMPIISSILFVIFSFVPRFDKKMSESIEIQRRYNQFICIFLLFLAYINVAVLSWNIAPLMFNLSQAIVVGFAFLFYFMGIIVSDLGQNYTFGIRVSPALSDERVWNRTHKFAGTLFKASAIISILGLLLPTYSFVIMLGSVMLSLVICIIYAYVEYGKIKK
jgi:uncharacterized membrane protein